MSKPIKNQKKQNPDQNIIVTKEPEIKEFHHKNHKKPVTRREFMSAGIIKTASIISSAPSLATLLLANPERAHAALTCPNLNVMPSPNWCPFITVVAGGGAGLSAMMWPQTKLTAGANGNRGYTPLTFLGSGNLNPNLAGNVRTDFGAPMVGLRNKVLDTLLTNLSADEKRGTKMGAVISSSPNDQQSERQGPYDLLNALTISQGSFHKGGTMSGSNFPSVSSFPGAESYNKIPVNTSQVLQGALSPLAFTKFENGASNTAIREKYLEIVKALSDGQTGKYLTANKGPLFQNLLNQLYPNIVLCDAPVNGSGQSPFDVRFDSRIAPIWGLFNGIPSQDENCAKASAVYGTLSGICGPVEIGMGGFDYHDDTRTSGDAADTRLGVLIARIIKTAKVLNQRFFMVVMSDGSVGSPANSDIWTSDSEANAEYWMIAFHPNGAQMDNIYLSSHNLGPNTQVGAFRTDGNGGNTADPDNTPFVSSFAQGMKAVIANYISFAGPDSVSIPSFINGGFSSLDERLWRIFKATAPIPRGF